MSIWRHWQDNLAGKKVPLHEATPFCGFYRMPHKARYGARRTFTPVAYYPGDEDGMIFCRIGDDDVSPERGAEIWTRVCNHPVSEEAYRGVAERNEPWPDEHELVSMERDNQPPEEDTFESLRDDIEPLATEAKRRIEGPPIQDQDEADRIANLADALAELHKKADDLRKEEKRPYDEAAKAVQVRWAPVMLMADTYKNLKYKLLSPWLKKLEEARKEAAEAAAAAGDPMAAGESARRPRAGTRGRAMTLKSIKYAEITDYPACLAFFKESPDVKAAVQDLANKAIRAGIDVPGAKLREESQAV